ncbi:MAG: copper resistance D family protein [Telluria sp.]
MEPDLVLAQRLVTASLNLSVAVLVGASTAHIWLRSARSAWGTGMAPSLRKLMLSAAAAAMAAYCLVLWLEAASMAEVPVADAFPAVRSVLSATHYGLAWMIGAAALLVVAAATWALPASRPGTAALAVRTAALGVFLYARSMVSHAGAGGDFSWAVMVDWIHLVLISIWVGEVIVAGLVTLRSPPAWESKNRAECAQYVRALSRSATVALAGIFATGLLSAWRVLGSPENAFGNPYGTSLFIKLGLVLCAAALGGINRFFVMPRLLEQLRQPKPSGGAHRRFAFILQAEACILVAVVVAAAFLSSTSPPSAS